MPDQWNARLPRMLISVALFMSAGCTAESGTGPDSGAPHRAELVVAAPVAPVSSRIGVRVRLPADLRLGAVQGRIRFDPATLAFAGQPLSGRTLVIVNSNATASGELRFGALDLRGIEPGALTFAFDVIQRDVVKGLGLSIEEAVPTDRVALVPLGASSRVTIDLALGTPQGAARRTIEDWIAYLGVAEPSRPPGGAALVPGAGHVYGDATLNGFVSALDAFWVMNVAVGNRPLLTEPTVDLVIAGNVAPANLPGLGEPNDPVPPGQNADGSRAISALDASAVSQEAVQNPQPVVGDPIPGRTPIGQRVVLAGTIDSGITRVLKRDTIYELQGSVVVQRKGKLVIEPGTRIEGDATTRGALVVARAGILQAIGTRLEPIVLTCNAPTPAPGCWGGVEINGFGVVNNNQTGGGNEIGCNERIAPSGQVYGGCAPQDSSGVLRYVRVEYAGMPLTPAAMSPEPSLALLGVGFRTRIDSVQVFGGSGDGLYLGGGNAQFMHVVLNNHTMTALRWDHGWTGRAQSLIVQQAVGNGGALRGSNFSENVQATPRSAPQLYNVTIAGPGALAGSFASGIVLEHGTDATIRNAVTVNLGGAGLDLSGAATCQRAAGGGINVESSVFFGNGQDFAGDADCIDELAYGTDPMRANRQVAPLLVEPIGTVTPDFRPGPGTPLASGFASPPVDGFFFPLPYVGAVPPFPVLGNVIPWYPGWTRGWP